MASSAAAQTKPQPQSPAPSGQILDERRARVDQFGDPLPAGAVARIGNVLYFHGTVPTSLAFSPDGKFLAVSSNNGNGATLHHPGFIRVLEAETGRQVRRLIGHDWTNMLQFSRDGKLLVSGGSTGAEDEVKVWDLTGKQLHRFNSGDGCALAPDGKTLASAGSEGDSNVIRFWDLTTGKQIRKFPAFPGGPLYQRAYAPDGRTLAGHLGAVIYLLDAATGKELHRLTGHTKMVSCLAYSPDGKWLASGGYDGTLRLWDPATGKELYRKPGFAEGRECNIAFGPDSKTIVATWADQTIRILNTADGQESGRIDTGEQPFSVAFSPNGRTLVWGTQPGFIVHSWDLAAGKRRERPPGPSRPIDVLAFSADAKSLITMSRGEPLRIWEATSGKELYQFGGRLGLRNAVAPRGDLAATADFRALRVCNLRTRKDVPLKWEMPTRDIRAPAFCPDGRLLAIAPFGDRIVLV